MLLGPQMVLCWRFLLDLMSHFMIPSRTPWFKLSQHLNVIEFCHRTSWDVAVATSPLQDSSTSFYGTCLHVTVSAVLSTRRAFINRKVSAMVLHWPSSYQ